MTTLRATQKVLRLLGPPADAPGPSTTALGDWYVNRLVVRRQPLLLLVSANSLLAIITPARDVRSLPARLPDLVMQRLFRLGVDPRWIEAEVAAMTPVVVAKTADRSVLGFMNEFVKDIPFYLDPAYHHEPTLADAERKLAEMPCWASKRIGESFYPARKTLELLTTMDGRPDSSAPNRAPHHT